jgi:uncharacterized protein YodC (DUF2158 family)
MLVCAEQPARRAKKGNGTVARRKGRNTWEEFKKQFPKGAKVKLSAGGPVMVVKGHHEVALDPNDNQNDNQIECQWFSGKKLEWGRFTPETLILVRKKTALTKINRSDKMSATALAVAEWMVKELEKQNGVLYQTEAASRIGDLFGQCFIYENSSGNACIEREVLAAFRALTGDRVVWSGSERLWRRREFGDERSRGQN